MAIPTLETPRLTLRPLSLADVDALHALWTNAEVRRYLWDDLVISRERAEDTVRASLACAEQHGIGLWVVLLRDAQPPAGFCGFVFRDNAAAPELLYGLAPKHWGRGLATEAARAAVAWLYQQRRWSRVTAATDPPNVASVRVLERLGMRFTHRGPLNGVETLFYELELTASPRTVRR